MRVLEDAPARPTVAVAFPPDPGFTIAPISGVLGALLRSSYQARLWSFRLLPVTPKSLASVSSGSETAVCAK